MTDERDTVTALLDRFGRTHAAELGIDPSKGPSHLFRLLCAAILFSARISTDIAVQAARALADEGWTTADKLADSTWARRAKVLNEAGYARYDERTASMLGETAEHVRDRYGGDLRRLRKEAGQDPKAERRLLTECKGLGDVGADIFFREVQGVWEELYPFVDKRARKAARALGLSDDPTKLAGLVDRSDFPRLVAALVRTELAGAHDEVRAAAG